MERAENNKKYILRLQSRSWRRLFVTASDSGATVPRLMLLRRRRQARQARLYTVTGRPTDSRRNIGQVSLVDQWLFWGGNVGEQPAGQTPTVAIP
jgi:hypothetical protein